MSNENNKLCVFSFGLAIGITWAVGILVMGLLACFFDYGTDMVNLFGTVYVGYEATILGTLIGTLWGLIDGFIAGVIIAFIYNVCIGCHCPWHK